MKLHTYHVLTTSWLFSIVLAMWTEKKNNEQSRTDNSSFLTATRIPVHKLRRENTNRGKTNSRTCSPVQCRFRSATQFLTRNSVRLRSSVHQSRIVLPPVDKRQCQMIGLLLGYQVFITIQTVFPYRQTCDLPLPIFTFFSLALFKLPLFSSTFFRGKPTHWTKKSQIKNEWNF